MGRYNYKKFISFLGTENLIIGASFYRSLVWLFNLFMHQAHLRFVVIILLSVFCIFLSLSLFFTYNYDGLFENLSIYFHYFQKISALSYIFYIALLFESVIRFNIVIILITVLISILLSISTLNYNEKISQL